MKVKKIPIYIFIHLFGLAILAGIGSTKHNLSITGTGTIKSTETNRVCVFCHTPHSSSSNSPLWNRNLNAGYTLYTSTTLISSPGQPDGASKLCLSCHDGTIALGEIVNPGITFAMLGTPDGKLPTTNRTNLSSNLSDDHPISFIPNTSSIEYNNPSIGDKVKLDHSGKLQCTSCHDPHNNTSGKFLAKSNFNSDICKTCHIKSGYSASSHDLSSATWNSLGTDPWPNTTYTTVSGNSCTNCHQTHKSTNGERLLNNSLEEEICFTCHNGNVASENIESVFSKTSIHNVSIYNGTHDPTEDTTTNPRHIECVDCHNPHKANNTIATAPNVNGVLLGVKGADLSGNTVNEAIYQYQICIKCHGGNVNFNILPAVTRAIDTSNIIIAINNSNQSHHPIASTGKSSHVPTLKSPYTTSSIIYCTDCHNSDSSTNAGGLGPNGPHGSNYNYILERNYSTIDYTTYSTAAYALCFKCHEASLIFSPGGSAFRSHPRHLNQGITCSTCHDSHGVPSGSADDGDHERLINFDTNVVSHPTNPALPPKILFTSTFGTCYVSCHGKVHNGKNFPRQ